MAGIEATVEFDDVPFGRGGGSQKDALQYALGAVAAASIGCAAALLIYHRDGAAPAPVATEPPATAAPQPKAAANPFGEMVMEPEWRSQLASLEKNGAPQAGLGGAPSAETLPPIPLPSLEPIPPTPSQPPIAATPPQSAAPPLADNVPLPPPRPAEFAPPTAPAAPDRRLTQQGAPPAAAPVDNRNFLQKLFGLGQPAGSPPAPSVASRPAAPPAPAIAPPAVASRPATASAPAIASAQPEGRGWRGLLAPFTGSPTARYDQYTAVYDISARTLYLPDGRRLEAHSGLGDRLDDPRFVSERARGATPPHLYELALREGSFHGVQALRLNPVGEGGVYGRAGLLAHPYMLGPNGDSNGCVSVKDYPALLRAYENGQIKRLAVVAQL